MRRIVSGLCWASAAFGLAVLVSALLGEWIPLIAIAVHLALYAALAGLAAAALGWWKGGRIAAVAALAIAGINAAMVFRASFGPLPPEEGSQTAKILLFNVKWDNARLDDVVALVERTAPDIVVLQEVYRMNRGELRALDLQFPYHFECWQSGLCDTLILSRRRLRDAEVVNQIEDARVDFARVEFDIGDCPVTLFATHLTRPWPARRLTSQAAQFRQVRALASAVRGWPGAKILVGDLNATAWSPVVRRLQEAMGGRALTGWHGTWPWFFPGIVKMPIDHVIVSQPQIRGTRQVLDPTGSDHSPVLATVSVDCRR
jgi:endonuclease/exonuclease/phosphatase (EEP) superfamily protein YafD